MAVRKMNFFIPEDLAATFVRRIPVRERSSLVARAIQETLRWREEELIRACRMANADKALAEVEQESSRIEDPIEELWDEDSSSR